MKRADTVDLYRFSAGYVLFFTAISAFGGYAVPFLVSRHIPSAQVGMLMAMMTVAGVVGQSVTGYLCDRYNTIRRFFYPMLILQGMFFGLLTHGVGMAALIFGLIGVGIFQYSLMALMESWVLEGSPHVKERYGVVRGWGSLGWAAGAILTGLAVDRMGWGIAPVIFITFAVLFIVVTWKMPDCNKTGTNVHNDPVSWSSIQTLLRNKRYQHLTATFILIFIAQNIIYSYSMVLIGTFGGTSFHMGLFMFVVCLFEFPAFFIMNRFIGRFGAASVLGASAAFYGLRGILVFLCVSIWQVIALGFMQTITYAAFMAASKYLVDEFCPPQLKTSSQMVAMAAYTGGAGVIAYLVAGSLADVIGIKGLMLVGGAAGFGAFGLSLGYVKTYYRKQSCATSEVD